MTISYRQCMQELRVMFPQVGRDVIHMVLDNNGGNVDNTLENILVPEPGSFALLGLGGLMVSRRRRA